MPDDAAPRARLRDVAALFLRLGFTAFGGPASHIAMMEREVVTKRRWFTAERFLDMLGAANLIPGPSSSELAVFIGYEQAGALGLVFAGVCFVLPAATMAALLAWAYLRYGALPRVGALLYGVKPVIVAIVVQALWRLAPKAIKKSPARVLLGVAVAVALAFGLDVTIAIFSAGALAALVHAFASKKPIEPPRAIAIAPAVVAAPASAGLASIALVFLKIGAVVFGSGYVLLAYLRADLVTQRHWLSEAQLLDAVAVGQVTPGPVFTTATFIGYLLAGTPGAIVATLAIFLPGFLLVAMLKPLVARVRRSPIAGAFLDGVNVASLAAMSVVTVQLARSALVDPVTIAIAIASAVLLVRFDASSVLLVAAGGVVGVVAKTFA